MGSTISKGPAEWCAERKLTVEELVVRSGLEAGRVQAILMGRWTPSPAERQTIASALDVPIDQITWGHVTPVQHLYGHGPG
jgi:transcriptional regulator with XRE-family HTH domain